mmetsp:Transcript_95669/g.308682  ORF Transcript_95669/g.308682 Transcript_95669/m.308682 type:complete len:266 (+) Transcript_95669:341-1138(+)
MGHLLASTRAPGPRTGAQRGCPMPRAWHAAPDLAAGAGVPVAISCRGARRHAAEVRSLTPVVRPLGRLPACIPKVGAYACNSSRRLCHRRRRLLWHPLLPWSYSALWAYQMPVAWSAAPAVAGSAAAPVAICGQVVPPSAVGGRLRRGATRPRGPLPASTRSPPASPPRAAKPVCPTLQEVCVARRCVDNVAVQVATRGRVGLCCVVEVLSPTLARLWLDPHLASIRRITVARTSFDATGVRVCKRFATQANLVMRSHDHQHNLR